MEYVPESQPLSMLVPLKGLGAPVPPYDMISADLRDRLNTQSASKSLGKRATSAVKLIKAVQERATEVTTEGERRGREIELR